ncbi:MAG: hypothetical protein KatS3mg114_0084 [Planctomycetaceae bacterium]|nr:MAG: hypothetical protein KatS3mg114_0084 [Planctomycetaceae bacterium]
MTSQPVPAEAPSGAWARQSASEETTEAQSLFSLENLPPFPRPWRHPLRCLAWLVRLGFGLVSLWFILAVLAALPLCNFVALGYLLEAMGRVGRTGKLRYALPLLPLAPRLGGLALGFGFWLLVLAWLAGWSYDAELVAPQSPQAANWRTVRGLSALLVGIHLTLAIARGGGLLAFFRPWNNLCWLRRRWNTGDYPQLATRALSEFFHALKIGYHFSLGLRGFVGAACWLVPPTLLFGALQHPQRPGEVLLMLVGATLLITILPVVPFLQAHFAATNALRAFREWRAVRQWWRRAPLSCWLAVVLLYALSLPLYLFKIVAPPRDALWFFTLIYVPTIYPGKILVAWAYAQAIKRTHPASWIWRWFCFLTLIPLLALYLFLLFFTPAISAAGRRVLFEHHPLLLPTPF